LDGTRTLADIAHLLQKIITHAPDEDPTAFQERVLAEIQQHLEWLARHALLVG
jgi:hypothetical protein